MHMQMAGALGSYLCAEVAAKGQWPQQNQGSKQGEGAREMAGQQGQQAANQVQQPQERPKRCRVEPFGQMPQQNAPQNQARRMQRSVKMYARSSNKAVPWLVKAADTSIASGLFRWSADATSYDAARLCGGECVRVAQ